MIIADRRWQWFALVVAITLAVFSRGLEGEFVLWDDDINIYRNGNIQRLTGAELAWMFGDIQHALRYKPLSWVTWALLYQAFAFNPGPYHAVNLLLHSVNAGLLFLVIGQLMKIIVPGSSSPGRVLAYAAGGALFWAINPLRVEAVAWATGLPYCLALMFLLISLVCYLSYLAGGAKWFYGASVMGFGLSLLTYPIGLTFPLVLLVLDWFLRRTSPAASLGASLVGGQWIRHVPFLLMTGIFVGVAAYGRMSASGLWSKPVSLDDFGLLSRMMQAAYIVAHYLWKPFVPIGLSPVYTTLVSFAPTDRPFLLSLAVIVALTGLCLRWPALLVLWLCHLAIVIPVLGLTEHPHYPSDRYSYVANTILGVAISFGMRWLHGRTNARVIAGIAITLLVLLFGLSVRQVAVWRSSIALFNHTIPRVKESRHLADLWRRLGVAHGENGDVVQAEAALQRAISIMPTKIAHYELAQLLRTEGRADEALFHAREAIRMDPQFARAYIEVGMVMDLKGQTADAIAHYKAALEHNPDALDALNNLAWIHATHANAEFRDRAQAVRLAERACALTGYQQALTVGTLAAAYAENGRFEEAVGMAEKAAALASVAGNGELAEIGRKMVEQYRARKPYREAR